MKNILKKVRKFLRLVKFKLFYKHNGEVEEKDLAIVMFGGLGDGVIALPFIKQLMDVHGKDNVVVFCNRGLVQLFKDYACAVNVCVFDHVEKYTKEWFEFCKLLKSYRFKRLLDINYSRATIKNGYIACNISAKEKIGIKGDAINMLKPNDIDKYYTKLIDVDGDNHESVNIYNFLRTVGYDVEIDLSYLKKFVDCQCVREKPYIVFAVGASLEYRIWPISKWVQVAKEILNTTDKDIIVCGSERESVYYNKIQEEINSERLINVCGKTTLAGLINLLGNCDFAIANDSGPAHIIASTGAKGVVLLGGGFNHRFFPYVDQNGNTTRLTSVEKKMDCFGCKWLCSSQEKFKCIKDIRVEDVIDTMKSFGKV